MSQKNLKAKHTLFYELQPIEADNEKSDYRLHIRADEDAGIKALKRWFHKNAYRKLYYFDSIADYYTIKKNGKYYLAMLEKDPLFMPVQGIR